MPEFVPVVFVRSSATCRPGQSQRLGTTCANYAGFSWLQLVIASTALEAFSRLPVVSLRNWPRSGGAFSGNEWYPNWYRGEVKGREGKDLRWAPVPKNPQFSGLSVTGGAEK